MRNIKAASRYAKSLLQLSIENNQLDKVFADISSLKATIEGSKELVDLFKSPIVKAEKKQSVIIALFGKDFSDVTIKFLNLIIDKRRESLIPSVAIEFVNQYEKNQNILSVEVVSAIKLEETQKNKVLSLINHTGKINLVESIDPTLIGGFILKMGDKQIDASISKRFKDLRKEIILN